MTLHAGDRAASAEVQLLTAQAVTLLRKPKGTGKASKGAAFSCEQGGAERKSLLSCCARAAGEVDGGLRAAGFPPCRGSGLFADP